MLILKQNKIESSGIYLLANNDPQNVGIYIKLDDDNDNNLMRMVMLLAMMI